MKITPFEFRLKDGRTACVRSPQAADVPAMLAFLRRMTGETDFVLTCPEECGKYTPEGETQLFERINAADNEAMPVCFVDGKLAGNCHVAWSHGIKTRHKAVVAIGLLREFWGLGIGTRLMEDLIRIAQENEQILQIELEFIEGNARARALYEKLGFRITGMKPDAVRLKDGTLLNLYAMMKKIER